MQAIVVLTFFTGSLKVAGEVGRLFVGRVYLISHVFHFSTKLGPSPMGPNLLKVESELTRTWLSF